ncbi:MAG: hypothetical protein ACOCYT_02805 [Chloroflexota bacterium]
MKVQAHADVFTMDSYRLGHVDRVVLDPHAYEVTHIVVEPVYDSGMARMIPVQWLSQHSTPERVVVRLTLADSKQLPVYNDDHYVSVKPPDDRSQGPDAVVPASYVHPLYYYPPRYPDADIVLTDAPTDRVRPGMRVHDVDGRAVGVVQQVNTYLPGDGDVPVPDDDGTSPLPRRLVITLKQHPGRRKAVPFVWVRQVIGQTIYLAVDLETVNQLDDLT